MESGNLIKNPKIHPKGWGREIWMANSELYCGKIMELKQGKKCSIHYHKLKDETFYILSGKVRMEIYKNGYPGEPTTLIMGPQDIIHLPRMLMHRFMGLEDSQIIEISTQHFEDDSYRLLKGD